MAVTPPSRVKNTVGGDLAIGILAVRRSSYWMLLQRTLTSSVYRKLQELSLAGANSKVNTFNGSLIVLLRSGVGLGSALSVISLTVWLRNWRRVVVFGP